MYVSRLLKTPVVDSSDAVIGKLVDILIKPASGTYAPLTHLVVQLPRGKGARFVPYEFVATLGRDGVVLKHLFSSVPVVEPKGDEVWLKRDILDQQIVDVEGARVVRVNDLKCALVGDIMCVIGIDVSWRGVLRRLGLSGLDPFNIFKVNLIDWRKAHPLKGELKLDTVSGQLNTLHPADLANVIEDLTIKQGSRLVGSLDTRTAAKVVEEMDPEVQKLVMRYLGPESAAKIVERMSTDEAVDLLQMMPKEEAKKFLSFLQKGQSTTVERLLDYPTDTAGGMMSLEFMSARPDWTVKETIEQVRRVSPTMRSLLYVYVTDEAGKLKGAVSLRGLLTASPDSKLKDITKRLPKSSLLKLTDHINKAVRVMTKYNLFTAAVLDHEYKLAGVLSIDDVMRHLVPHA